MNETKVPLKVFLCHTSIDKPKVRKLYHYLKSRGVQPWLDEYDLLPGQNWKNEIPKAVADSDVIIICLTKNSVNRQGYVQNEIKLALDKALEMPDGQIFIIPLLFEECEIPSTLRQYQWMDLSNGNDYSRLLRSLESRASQLGRTPIKSKTTTPRKKGDPQAKAIVSRQRVLEAAIQKQVFVEKPASLFVWVRRRGSKNIISVVKSIDKDVRLDEGNLQANDLEIVFPIKDGKTLAAEITLRLDAREFEPPFQEKKIYIPPNGDSKVYRFVVTPKRAGELLLNLEVLRGGINVGEAAVRTTAIDKEGKIDNPIALMVIPIFVLVKSPITISGADSPAQSDNSYDEKALDSGNQISASDEKPGSDPEKPIPKKRWFEIKIRGEIWAAIIVSIATILAAVINTPARPEPTPTVIPPSTASLAPVGTDTPFLPTETMTLTNTETVPTVTPTDVSSIPGPCTSQSRTDDETIVSLIQAEATAVNSKNYELIRTIFDPNAVFIDYLPEPPVHWNGPRGRYELTLFKTTDFQGVEHFDISPAVPGIVGNTAYYTSGSRGQYRNIGSIAWKPFENGSAKTTRYGSDQWVLKKNNNGCWLIVEMHFNAGDERFP